MYSNARWRASIAACLLSYMIVPPQAAAADWGDETAPGTSYYTPSERRPLDGSYRAGYGATDWTGLYFGADIGWAGGQEDLSGAINRTVESSGYLGGLHAGYNFHSGSLVAGLEVDADWTGAQGLESLSGGDKLDVSADWLSSLRMRLGYATGSWMFYGTAGVALTGLDVSLTGPGADSLLSETLTGYAVGLGAELALTQSVSARVEALHYGFSEEVLQTSRGFSNTDLDLTSIRGGLSIKLN
jgi:outer membrane immunogenic protein